jgi:hypothetical protein
MLSLVTSGDQTPAVSLEPAAGRWEATFTLSMETPGRPLFAELRALPGGAPAVVALGEGPRLEDSLEVSVGDAYLDPAGEQVAVHLEMHNAGEGDVYLPANYIRLKGGDADEPAGQVETGLPTLLEAGERLALTATFPLPAPLSAEPRPLEDAGPATVPGQEVQLQIGAGLWAIGLPADAEGPRGP